jgi:aspartyl-tRNA(Asn)/glutamyl-tRNA(Gln) amidotransferase subunit A
MPPPRPGATEIAEAVRSGRIRARDVLEEHLARIAATEVDVHAFNLLIADQARDAADRIDAAVAGGRDPGVMAGVPVALKDNLCTHGVATTCSSRILEGWVPPYDATVVARLEASGAVLVGKTNMDEFAMGSSTENSAFGPTRNPHDLGRVPGGSSGGSAAAVAAGFVAASLGSDTGGSIRQPASLCGVVGVKPTYGLVSRYGLVAFASSLDQVGPLASNVADAALVLDVISGPDPADSTSLRDTPPAASARLGEGVEGLRVGVVTELSTAEGVAPDVVAQTRAAAEALAAAGAKVEEVSVPAAVYGLSAYYLIAPAEASSNLARYDGVRYGLRVEDPSGAGDITGMYLRTRSEGFGAEVKRRIMLGTYALSAGYYDAYYGKAQQVRTLIIRDFDSTYEHFDVLLGPTSPTTAFALGAKTADPLTMYINDVCTIPSSLAGHPAMSVPFGAGDDGLPVGVQILARALGETVMFQVAAALESLAPAAPDAGTMGAISAPAELDGGPLGRDPAPAPDPGRTGSARPR